MDPRREKLKDLLIVTLGSEKVYFQPPASSKMSYPCIVYERSNLRTLFADNNPYATKKRYNVTLIDSDPDNAVFDKLANLPMCSFDRHFTADNLHHDVFVMYF